MNKKKKLMALFLVFVVGILPNMTVIVHANQSRYGYFNSNYTLTGNGASDMVAIAKAQLGRKQSEFGYTEGWCDNFVADCAILANQAAAIPQGGDVSDFLNNLVKAGAQYVSSPKAGDVVIFKSASSCAHAALMSSSTYCINGNFWTSGYSQVEEWTYSDLNSYNSWTCVFLRPNYKNNTYTYTSITPGTYYLKNNNSGNYLCVSYGTDANKQNIDLLDFRGGDAQKFSITSTGNGYKMRPLCSSSRLVNAWGDSPSSGSNVNLYEDVSDSTQWWKFEAVSGGYIIHSVYNSSLVLDTDGSNVLIRTRNGGASQIWTLQPDSSYTISYNANGGSNAPTSQIKKWGVDTTISSAIPVRSGYIFVGWATSASATSAVYSAGAAYKENKNITLYAVWKTDSYTVKFNANGGYFNSAVNTYTVKAGESFIVPEVAVSKNYHRFLGWSKNSTDTSPLFVTGDVLTLNENVTLYAIWQPPTEIRADEKNHVTINGADEEQYFTFTPDETAYYRLRSTSIGNDIISIRGGGEYKKGSSNSDSAEGGIFRLEKGCDYMIDCGSFADFENYDFILEKTDITGMQVIMSEKVYVQTPKLGTYETYKFDPQITIFSATGVYFSGTKIELSKEGLKLHFSDLIDVSSPGVKKVTVQLSDLVCDTTIEVLESPIQNIEISSTRDLIEEVDWVSYASKYEYSSILTLNVLLKDGEYIHGSYNDVTTKLYAKYNYLFTNEFRDTQNSEKWNIGEHTVELEIAGYCKKFCVNLEPNPVQEIIIESDPIEFLKGECGHFREDGSYFLTASEVLKEHPIPFLITYTDGTKVSAAFSAEEYDNQYLSSALIINGFPVKGELSPWHSEDGMYTFTLSYMEKQVEISVTVLENPDLDLICNAKCISVPRLQTVPNGAIADLSGIVLEVTLESGKTEQIVLCDESPYADIELIVDGVQYRYRKFFDYYSEELFDPLYVYIMGKSIVIPGISHSTEKVIKMIELLSAPTTVCGDGAIARLYFTDNTFADVQFLDFEGTHGCSGEWESGCIRTDQGYYIPIHISVSEQNQITMMEYRINYGEWGYPSFMAEDICFTSKALANIVAENFENATYNGEQTTQNIDLMIQTAISVNRNVLEYNGTGILEILPTEMCRMIQKIFDITAIDVTKSSLYDSDNNVIRFSGECIGTSFYGETLKLYDETEEIYTYYHNEFKRYITIRKSDGKVLRVFDSVYGDSTGDQSIDMKDVVLLRKYMAEFDYDSNTSAVAVEIGGDVNGDGNFDMKDVVLLRKYIADFDYDTGTSSVVLGPQ